MRQHTHVIKLRQITQSSHTLYKAHALYKAPMQYTKKCDNLHIATQWFFF